MIRVCKPNHSSYQVDTIRDSNGNIIVDYQKYINQFIGGYIKNNGVIFGKLIKIEKLVNSTKYAYMNYYGPPKIIPEIILIHIV